MSRQALPSSIDIGTRVDQTCYRCGAPLKGKLHSYELVSGYHFSKAIRICCDCLENTAKLIREMEQK